MGALSHINQYFWKYKWLLVLGILFTLFSNFFGVFPAQLVRYALDLVTETIDIYFLFFEAKRTGRCACFGVIGSLERKMGAGLFFEGQSCDEAMGLVV